MKKLNKELMKFIYTECTKNVEQSMNAERTAELKDVDILKALPYKFRINQDSLRERILGLATEDYFECKEKHNGQGTTYFFSLLNKGKSFCKELESDKRAIKFKIILTISGAVLSFVIGTILKSIFNR